MADHFICTEGDTDRVVFERLAPGATVLPVKPKPCTSKADQPQGSDAAIKTGLDLARGAVIRVTIALDVDTGTPAEVHLRVERAMRDAGFSFSGGAGRYLVDKTEVRVVAVGLPGNPVLRDLGVAAHAVDDYLILLLADGKVQAGLFDKRFISSPQLTDFQSILKSTLQHLRERGISAAGSKQLLDVSRAILGFRASPATMAQAILSVAPPDLSQSVLAPLAQAMQ